MIAIVTIELGLLTPPFGMVVFAMKAAAKPWRVRFHWEGTSESAELERNFNN